MALAAEEQPLAHPAEVELPDWHHDAARCNEADHSAALVVELDESHALALEPARDAVSSAMTRAALRLARMHRVLVGSIPVERHAVALVPAVVLVPDKNRGRCNRRFVVNTAARHRRS